MLNLSRNQRTLNFPPFLFGRGSEFETSVELALSLNQDSMAQGLSPLLLLKVITVVPFLLVVGAKRSQLGTNLCWSNYQLHNQY